MNTANGAGESNPAQPSARCFSGPALRVLRRRACLATAVAVRCVRLPLRPLRLAVVRRAFRAVLPSACAVSVGGLGRLACLRPTVPSYWQGTVWASCPAGSLPLGAPFRAPFASAVALASSPPCVLTQSGDLRRAARTAAYLRRRVAGASRPLASKVRGLVRAGAPGDDRILRDSLVHEACQEGRAEFRAPDPGNGTVCPDEVPQSGTYCHSAMRLACGGRTSALL
jgi:hypothetical protein